MTQLIQFKPSVQSIDVAAMSSGVSVARKNDDIAVEGDAAAVENLEAELHEHRYYLEQKVEQRTAQLTTRITLLESCNATLANKLAESRKEIALLRKQLTSILEDCSQASARGARRRTEQKP